MYFDLLTLLSGITITVFFVLSITVNRWFAGLSVLTLVVFLFWRPCAQRVLSTSQAINPMKERPIERIATERINKVSLKEFNAKTSPIVINKI